MKWVVERPPKLKSYEPIADPLPAHRGPLSWPPLLAAELQGPPHTRHRQQSIEPQGTEGTRPCSYDGRQASGRSP